MENKTIRNSGFGERERIGREKFERMWGRFPHEFTTGKYAPWDVSITGKTKTCNIEIKDKDEPISKWEKQGFILEVFKYVKLIAAYKLTGSLPIYLNFFQNGDAFSCNLLDIEPNWEWRLCTSTTADGTYGEVKEWKYVTMIPFDKVKKFKYE